MLCLKAYYFLQHCFLLSLFSMLCYFELSIRSHQINQKLLVLFLNLLHYTQNKTPNILIRFSSFQVVTALGKTYHQKCFTCNRCRQPFPSGEKVTYTGKEVLCPKCVQIPVRDATPKTSPTANSATGKKLTIMNIAPSICFN